MQIVGWHNATTGALRAGLSLLNKPVVNGPALSFKYYTLIVNVPLRSYMTWTYEIPKYLP